MDLESEVDSADSALKSSLDPSASNVIETPEKQPEESSADYEADPADPDTIDPELINAQGFDREAVAASEEDLELDLDADIADPDLDMRIG